MNKKQTLADQIVEIDEHINHLQWRCENTINHSELKKLRKTIKGLNKSRLKLSRKFTKGEESHDKIT